MRGEERDKMFEFRVSIRPLITYLYIGTYASKSQGMRIEKNKLNKNYLKIFNDTGSMESEQIAEVFCYVSFFKSLVRFRI